MQDFSQLLAVHVFDIAGVIGFLGYVAAYTGLTFGVMTCHQVRYFALNLIASSLVLFSLVGAFNLAALMIQVFWIAISAVAIYRRVQAKRAHRTAASGSFAALRAASSEKLGRAVSPAPSCAARLAA